MTASSIDAATGNLVLGGKPVFPIGLSDPPPLGSTAPSGADRAVIPKASPTSPTICKRRKLSPMTIGPIHLRDKDLLEGGQIPDMGR